MDFRFNFSGILDRRTFAKSGRRSRPGQTAGFGVAAGWWGVLPQRGGLKSTRSQGGRPSWLAKGGVVLL